MCLKSGSSAQKAAKAPQNGRHKGRATKPLTEITQTSTILTQNQSSMEVSIFRSGTGRMCIPPQGSGERPSRGQTASQYPGCKIFIFAILAVILSLASAIRRSDPYTFSPSQAPVGPAVPWPAGKGRSIDGGRSPSLLTCRTSCRPAWIGLSPRQGCFRALE